MLSRRIRAHAADLNWVGVAVDLAIVIIGVFLGMQVNDWNQARLDRRQAREYRAMLLNDVDANLESLATRKRYYGWVKSEALATLADLDRPASALDEQFLAHAYQASQMQPWALKRNTYDEVVSTGAMAKLGDAVLRDEIANYYVGADVTGANIAALPPYREIIRRVLPYAVQQAVRSRCNERIVQSGRGSTDVLLPQGRCELGLDSTSVRSAVAQVHDWPGLSLDLNRQIVDLDQKLLSVDTISDRATTLKKELQDANR
jgi:hypothetical protein